MKHCDEPPPTPNRDDLARWIAVTCGVADSRARHVLDGILNAVNPLDRRAQEPDRVARVAASVTWLAGELRKLEARLDDLIELAARMETRP